MHCQQDLQYVDSISCKGLIPNKKGMAHYSICGDAPVPDVKWVDSSPSLTLLPDPLYPR